MGVSRKNEWESEPWSQKQGHQGMNYGEIPTIILARGKTREQEA